MYHIPLAGMSGWTWALLHQNGGIVNQISATSEHPHTDTRMQGEELKQHMYVLAGMGDSGEYIISL